MAEYIDKNELISKCHPVIDVGMSLGNIGVTLDEIREIPAADVRENARGEWKEKIVDDPSDSCGLFRRRFYFTVCGNWQTYGRPNFCPCCGSDNRGDKNECAENI